MRMSLKSLAGLGFALTASAPAFAAQAQKIVDPTSSWNKAWTEVLIDLWVIGIVFGVAAIYMLVKYRATSPDQVGQGKKPTLGEALGWALVPAALFLAADFFLSAKGWSLWNIQRTVPANAMEIKVTGSQWAFTYEYPGGLQVASYERDPGANIFAKEVIDGDLVVPVGQPVVLRMVSNDVLHSFGLTDYRLKEDMMPGRVTYLWFVATEPKVSQVVCVEFCGTNHSQMFNRVVSVPKEQYDSWMAAKRKKAGLDPLPDAKTVAALAPNAETVR